MALSNAALLLLLENRVDTGINLPPCDLEMSIIDDIRAGGRMDKEIDFILKGNI
jgi:hypothetical protein